MRRRGQGENGVEEALQTLLRESVRDVVAKQAAAGIDYVSDGELSKPSYATYISERLSGFGREWNGHEHGDLQLSADLMDAGLNKAVKEIEKGYPPEWRMSYSGRKAP
jgi:methionine synthase II (cobalamin-independent)